MRKTNIAIVTGTRAEFGIWQSVLHAVQASKKLRLQLLVTGMHLQRSFGYTVRDIQASPFPIAAKVPMYQSGDTPAKSLARGTAGIAAAFRKLKPDLVMVLGDRLEMLAAASAALACQVPLAHVHGGESAPAQWDEQIRHALTKMSHLHFCATKLAARRIAQMGEDPQTIHVVGAPALDTATALADGTLRFMKKKHLDYRKIGVLTSTLVLHPSSSSEKVEYRRTLLVVDVLRKMFPDTLIRTLGPNNDPGHRGILRAYRERAKDLWLDMSLLQVGFWAELLGSSLLIGNSSSGILEAATFGIPVINLGERQSGRQRNPNVLDVPWSAGRRGIENAIRHALTRKPFLKIVAKRQNLYGDGHAAPRIIRILESLTPPLSTTKRFYDI